METHESKYLHIRPPKEVMWAAVAFLAVTSILFIGKIKNEFKGLTPATISVNGEGRVFIKPDIAIINVGVSKQSFDLLPAQQQAADVINKVSDFLKSKGVEEKDIKTTSYNISPRYDYNEGIQIFRGYEVHQNLEIKIRDLSKVGAIISGSAQAGANQVGSLQFTVDDPKAAANEARAKAIKEAREKAVKLSKDLGVGLKKIIAYNESQGGYQPPMPYYSKGAELGRGGDLVVPSGENEVLVNVSITYELK